ncbi:MAG TPA: glycosyl hydrolase family 28-related protein, partial [Methylibium sp.]|uniref:glycosyl hydrolase family 28-related protein n=1 Tax=Methylibium sp. TaxID=2067992 RepID=UPI002DB72DED
CGCQKCGGASDLSATDNQVVQDGSTPAPAPAPGTGTGTGTGTVTPVPGQTLSLKASMEDMEAIGPFASWRNAKAAGAVADGRADDTAALQRAIDAMTAADKPGVLHLPAGTYRITSSLAVNASATTYGLSIVGDDPATTRIVWDGPAGGAMLVVNGGFQPSFARLTWDGRGRAGYGVAHWWLADGPLHGGSAEHADEVFTDMEIGIQGGRMGDGYGQLDSEGQVRRVKFVRNSKAGLNVGSWNALNWWVWDSQFVDCARGVSNKFTVGADSGAGSFFVYRSLFERSTVADAEIGNTATFAIYASMSIGSRRFFQSERMGLNTSRQTLQGNRVLDTTDPVAVYAGNLGPLSLIDNEFRSAAGQGGPVVRLDNFLVGTDVLSVGNKFTVAEAIAPRDGTNRVVSIGDRSVERGSLASTRPSLPPTPVRAARQVFEVAKGASGAAIQAAIDAAAQAAAAGAVNPIVHLPAGSYDLSRTLVVPANTRMTIAGDSVSTEIHWALSTGGPMIRLAGPSLATVRDLRLNGQLSAAIGIDRADQDGGRILLVGNSMGPVAATGLAKTRLSMQANTTLAAMNLGGVASALSLGAGGFGPLTLRDNSQLLMSDNWYEGQQTRLFTLESGRLTYRGGNMAPADPVHGGGAVEPVITLDGFRGSATFLGIEMTLQDAGNGVRAGQTTAETKALFAGIKSNQPRFFDGGSGAGKVKLMLAKEPLGSGIASLVSAPATGAANDDSFVLEMLAQSRSVEWESAPATAPRGATDVRLYRLLTADSAVGLRITAAP